MRLEVIKTMSKMYSERSALYRLFFQDPDEVKKSVPRADYPPPGQEPESVWDQEIVYDTIQYTESDADYDPAFYPDDDVYADQAAEPVYDPVYDSYAGQPVDPEYDGPAYDTYAHQEAEHAYDPTYDTYPRYAAGKASGPYQEQVSFCTQCGHKYQELDIFCARCGNRIANRGE